MLVRMDRTEECIRGCSLTVYSWCPRQVVSASHMAWSRLMSYILGGPQPQVALRMTCAKLVKKKRVYIFVCDVSTCVNVSRRAKAVFESSFTKLRRVTYYSKFQYTRLFFFGWIYRLRLNVLRQLMPTFFSHTRIIVKINKRRCGN